MTRREREDAEILGVPDSGGAGSRFADASLDCQLGVGLQRGHLRKRREQVHANAELQVRSGDVHLLQGVLLVPVVFV